MIQNIGEKETIYCLFSNNQINKIASMRFNFEDDEVLGLYVNLLKTISLKLDEHTVQFFLVHPSSKQGRLRFPLYSEALKFGTSKDGMVRAAVRNLTLNAFTIPSISLRSYFGEEETRDFFDHVSSELKDTYKLLDQVLQSKSSNGAQVEQLLSYIDDEFTYFNDVWSTNIPMLRSVVLRYFWKSCILDIVLAGFVKKRSSSMHHISQLTVLCVLETFFSSIQNRSLLTLLASILLGGDAVGIADEILVELRGDSDFEKGMLSVKDLVVSTNTEQAQAVRDMLLSSLKHHDPHIANGSVRLITSIVANSSVSEDALSTIGLAFVERGEEDSTKQSTQSPNHHLQRRTPSPTLPASRVDSYPMRHSEIFESIASASFGDRFGEIVEAIFRIVQVPNICPLTLMAATWSLAHMAAPDLQTLKTYCDSNVLQDMMHIHCDMLLQLVSTGQWADGIPMMMKFYWKKHRQMYQKKTFATMRACVLSWEFSNFLQRSGRVAQEKKRDLKVDLKMCLLTVMSLVSTMQLSQLVKQGCIDEEFPFHGPMETSWVKLKDKEPKQGDLVDPSGTTPCHMVNQSNTMCDLLLKLETSSNPDDAWYDKVVAVVLLDDSSNSLTEPQKVVAVAPAASAQPTNDKKSATLLHVAVRPPLSTVLKAFTLAPSGADFSTLDHCISSENWRISFVSTEDCLLTHNLLKQVIEDLRERSTKYIIDIKSTL